MSAARAGEGVPCVLVTGGAGYIGSHACEALAEAGYLPVTYDSLISGHTWAVKWGPLERGDVADTARVHEVLRQYRPMAVMHFAAHIDSAESVSEPKKYYRNNVGGSLSLLEAMREAGVKQLVYSSSAAVYGIPQSTPIVEDHPLQPINPYGSSKLMVENALREHSSVHGFEVVILRYFNAAGASYQSGIGESHYPESHLIPRIISAAQGQRDDVVLHGADYPTPDGTCIRDYVHVCDLAEAHVRALQRLSGEKDLSVFNLGGGRGHSVREVIDAVQRMAERPIALRVGPRRAGDPPVLLSDIRRACRDLGWRPRRSSLEELLSDAWRWHLSRSQ